MILPHTLFGQEEKNPPKAENELELSNDSIFEKDDENYLFPFINHYAYYYDEDEYNEIKKNAAKGYLEKTYQSLYNYVMKFGPKNFQKDNYLLWRLAKMAEQLGYTGKAKAFYRLVIKHHPSGQDMSHRRPL
ncbi:MAG: hypothetical protein HC880_01130 [Bacteroidia bacterium]|nr:hypothetical protein [Bacteroidia bacterium]